MGYIVAPQPTAGSTAPPVSVVSTDDEVAESSIGPISPTQLSPTCRSGLFYY